MEMTVVDGSTVSLSERVFGQEFKGNLVHQVVTAYRAAGRSGTKAQKTRSDLSGTTKKFKKQKGGGARHGDYRAPIFVGGGVTFAARPRSFAQKVNRTMYRSALRSVFSELARSGRLLITESLAVDSPKTKSFVALMNRHGVDAALFVTDSVEESLHLAARNIPRVAVVDVNGVNPVALVHAPKVVLTRAALDKIEEWLA